MSSMIILNKIKLHHLIVLLLICVSGNPVFTADGRQELVLILFSFFLVCCVLKEKIWLLTPKFCLIVSLFSSILIFQSFSFSFFPIMTISGFLIRLFIGYASLRLVPSFARTYINVMYSVCILGLAFYFVDQITRILAVDFRSFWEPLHNLTGVETNFHTFLYNFQVGDYVFKNALFFWEPGAAAGYILLALILLGITKDTFLILEYRLKFLILCVCLLTTFSTTGYLVLPVVFMTHHDFSNSSKKAAIKSFLFFFLALCVILTYAVYIGRFEFIGEKLAHQYSQATAQEGNWEINRFGTFLSDLEYIKQRPVFGWGLHESTRYMLSADKDIGAGQGNGLTGFTVKFGLIGLLTFIFFTWKGIAKLSGPARLKSIFGIIAILMLLNGEPYLNYPLFLGLMFLIKADSRAPVSI